MATAPFDNDWMVVPFGSNLRYLFFLSTGPCTGFDWYVEGLAAGEAELELTFERDSAICNDLVALMVIRVDLDIDSDNDNGTADPGRSEAEDAIEDSVDGETHPGKFVEVNNGDDDDDCIPDFADGFDLDAQAGNADDACANEVLVPLILEIPEPIDITSARLRFTYGASDPWGVQRSGSTPPIAYTAPSGHLRVWTQLDNRDGATVASDSAGHYVPEGEFDSAMLGFGEEQRVIKLYLEGVAPGSSGGDQRIVVEVDPDGDGPTGWVAADAVRTTVVQTDLDIDSDNNATIDDYDDPIEGKAPGCILAKDLEGDSPEGGPIKEHLKPMTLEIVPEVPDSKVVLSADAGVLLWADSNGTTQVSLPHTYDPPGTMPDTLYVDGDTKGAQASITLEYVYKPASDLEIGTDELEVFVTETPSWAPAKANVAYVWSSLPSLGEGDATAFQDRVNPQGFTGVSANSNGWFRDSTGSADTDFEQCRLANYKNMRNAGAFCVVSHGERGAHHAVYAVETSGGQAACDAWRAGEPDMTTDHWIGDCYTVRVSSKWLAANYASTLNANKSITFWDICYSATGNPSQGEASVMEAAGGRWRIGYINPTYESQCTTVNTKFLERMNGTTDNAEKRTAGEAYDNKSGYPSNVQMDGNDWTTLCPAPMTDDPFFPGTVPGNRYGWGCTIFDTYMRDAEAAGSALIGISGTTAYSPHWAGDTSYGKFILGFSYDKTGGTGQTVRAVADHCKNADPDGGREMDGDRVTPNGDDRDWPY